jgi:hypothetical protein
MTATAYSKNDLSDTQGSAIFKGGGGSARKFRYHIEIITYFHYYYKHHLQ